MAQSDAVDLYLIDREISLDIIIFFFQVVSKNPSMQKKKSILNDMLFITHGSGAKGDRNFPLASIGIDTHAKS